MVKSQVPHAGETFRDPIWYHRRSSPDSTAIVDGESGRSWRYHAVDLSAEAMAGQLRAGGVDRGSLLGILLETGSGFVHLVHAAHRAGCAIAPLNVRRPPSRLHERIERLDVAGVVYGSATEDLVGDIDPPCPTFELVHETDDPRLGSVKPASIDPPSWRLDDEMVVLGTSGTTGRPKSVSLSVGNILASAMASAVRLGVLPDDRWLCCLPMYHMGGLAPVYRSTLYGTTAVVVPGDGFDPARTSRIAAAHRVTGASMVPTMLDRMLEDGWTVPDSLRFLLLGGGPIDPDLVERASDRGIPVCPTYGASETASQVATARPDEAGDHPSTVGRPLPGVVVTIVDDDGDPVDPGTAGEIVVAGPTVMRGYRRDPEATARAFGPHGFHTGDLGIVDEDGRLSIRGRRGDRIVTGGENVDPAAVRSVLESHPSVAVAAVVGVPDEEWGEAVGAVVVPASASGAPDPSPAALRTYCAERLSDFEVPKWIVAVEDLPRTASGTVDRAAVRRRLRNARSDSAV